MTLDPETRDSGAQGDNLAGIGLIVCATLLFSGLDAITKQLVMRYDVPLVAAMRYGVQLALILLLFGPRHGTALVGARRPALAVLRGACLALSALFMALALQRMPIAETTAIIYLAPVLVVLLAGPVLGEQVRLLSWLAALGGFVGVLIVVRPGSGLDPLGLLFSAANVITTAAYSLLSRLLAPNERTSILLFYAALVGAAAFGLMAPWFWFDAMPGPSDLLLLLLLLLLFSVGALALIGHGILTIANRFAEASLIAPVSYSQLLWAGLLGWLIFGQRPDAVSIAGMGLLLGAGLLVSFKAGPTSHRSQS